MRFNDSDRLILCFALAVNNRDERSMRVAAGLARMSHQLAAVGARPIPDGVVGQAFNLDG